MYENPGGAQPSPAPPFPPAAETHAGIFCLLSMQDKTKETFFLQRLRSSIQDLPHFLLDCLTFEPLQRAVFDTISAIFDLWSRPCGMARILALRGIPPRFYFSKRLDSTTATINSRITKG